MTRLLHSPAWRAPLGPLEQRLLEALWQRGPSTVRELVDTVCRDLAYTTVMTTLDRLFKKSVLARETEGRAFRYSPRLTHEELQRQRAGEMFRQLLDASTASSLPLSYLVEIVTEHDEQLIDDLGEAIEAKRRQLGLKNRATPWPAKTTRESKDKT